MNDCPRENCCTVRIIAIIEPNAATNAYSFNWMLDSVRNWRGFGYRFIVVEHTYSSDSITAELVKDADELWFFGTGTPDDPKTAVTLSKSDLEVVATCMNAGVGVFATGDHHYVGSGLCEQIPRAGKMRLWSGKDVPARDRPDSYESTTRSPTPDLVDPLVNADKECSPPDDRDALPKTIWSYHEPDGNPHRLMQLPVRGVEKGTIRFLPDHMHEGKLLDYYEEDANSNPVLQLPAEFEGTRPRIVARSVRAVFDANKQPADCASYPVVSVYEPPEASRRGNVVVDSTFHHWTDGNLLQIRYSPAWRHVERYAINVADWLLNPVRRKELKSCLEKHIVATTKSDDDVLADIAMSKRGDYSKLARSVTYEINRRHVVADSLEHILLGSVVSSERDKLNQLAEELELPQASAEELKKLVETGDLQNAFLGLQFKKLRNEAARQAAADEERRSGDVGADPGIV